MSKKKVKFNLPPDSPISPRDKIKRRQRLEFADVKREVEAYRQLKDKTFEDCVKSEPLFDIRNRK